MSTTAQRKAWNEAMRSAAGASAVIPQNQLKRRSDRRKKQDRRDKARKVQNLRGAAGDDADQEEFQAAVWLDALDDVDPSILLMMQDLQEDDEYDAYEELKDSGGKTKKNSRKRGGGAGGSGGSGNKRKRGGGGGGTSAPGQMPKRFLPRTLGAILMEEANRGEIDGSAKAFVDAEARIQNPQQQIPKRKFCPVTGLMGIYTEPKSGIPYANWKALEQIRERAPPWMTLGGTTPSYWEAAKSLRDE